MNLEPHAFEDVPRNNSPASRRIRSGIVHIQVFMQKSALGLQVMIHDFSAVKFASSVDACIGHSFGQCIEGI